MKLSKIFGAAALAVALTTSLAGCNQDAIDNAAQTTTQQTQTVETAKHHFEKTTVTHQQQTQDDNSGPNICVGVCMGPHIDLSSGELRVGPSFGGIGLEF